MSDFITQSARLTDNSRRGSILRSVAITLLSFFCLVPKFLFLVKIMASPTESGPLDRLNSIAGIGEIVQYFQENSKLLYEVLRDCDEGYIFASDFQKISFVEDNLRELAEICRKSNKVYKFALYQTCKNQILDIVAQTAKDGPCWKVENADKTEASMKNFYDRFVVVAMYVQKENRVVTKYADIWKELEKKNIEEGFLFFAWLNHFV